MDSISSDGIIYLGKVKPDLIESVEILERNGSYAETKGPATYFHKDQSKRLRVIWDRNSGNRYIDQWGASGEHRLKAGNGLYVAKEYMFSRADSSIYEVKDSVFHGTLTVWSEAEDSRPYIIVTSTYVYGEEEGIRSYYRSDGSIRLLEERFSGHDTITTTSLRNDNNVELKGASVNGRREGTWQEYHKNGQLSTTSTYVAGIRDGPGKSYWPTGEIKYEGTYCPALQTVVVNQFDPETYEVKLVKSEQLVPEKCGTWTFFDEEGKLIRREDH